MKTIIKRTAAIAAAAMMLFAISMPAFAAAEEAQTQTETTADEGSIAVETAKEEGAISGKAMAAAICVGIAAAGGGIGMGLTTAKSTESIARQPEASGDIRTAMMLGFVFIETAIIYALIVSILVIFVL